MRDIIHVYIQYVVPQRLLTQFAGVLANAKTPWLKKWIIHRFIRKYHIELQDALIIDPDAYANFNEFFTRKLTSASRPINANAAAIVSPADGTIAQMGNIHQGTLLQAKGFNFSLDALFGNDKKTATIFQQGTFATIYLAPSNYHRVHMPVDGQLEKTIYVPGKLFSVNALTANHIPNLYSRNERLICIFQTAHGKMAVIFVGAMIVGSIQPSWLPHPVRAKQITTLDFPQSLTFKKGEELGYFNLGSTVIVLFEQDQVEWLSALKPSSTIKMGELLANTKSKS